MRSRSSRTNGAELVFGAAVVRDMASPIFDIGGQGAVPASRLERGEPLCRFSNPASSISCDDDGQAPRARAVSIGDLLPDARLSGQVQKDVGAAREPTSFVRSSGVRT